MMKRRREEEERDEGRGGSTTCDSRVCYNYVLQLSICSH